MAANRIDMYIHRPPLGPRNGNYSGWLECVLDNGLSVVAMCRYVLIQLYLGLLHTFLIGVDVICTFGCLRLVSGRLLD